MEIAVDLDQASLVKWKGQKPSWNRLRIKSEKSSCGRVHSLSV